MSEQLIKTPSVFGDNGNFLLERELGTGGMGGVYMGRDKMLDRPVAVKVLLKEFGSDAVFLEKFKKEAQAAARLIHPNIVQVYSYGIVDGMPYMAMELAAGGSLFSLMNTNKGKTDIQRVLKICQQTALALQCASDQGVIHGDVKPENILFDANGNAKLVDFGLAAMQKDTTEIWGTPYYISPEKVKKEAIDFRADMYSLGGTLYHALTGVAPFEGDDAVAVVKKRFEGMPKKPSEIRPDISPAIDTLVMTMLEVDRENRYPSFEALLEAFKEVLSTGLTKANPRPVDVKSPSASTGVKRPTISRKRRVVIRKPLTSNAESGDEISNADAEEDEKSDNLGKKVTLVVIGVIALLGAIGGGLFWYTTSAAKARERETQNSIIEQGQRARIAVQTNRQKAVDLISKYERFVNIATNECEKLTAAMAKLLPDFADKLRLAPPVDEAAVPPSTESQLRDEVLEVHALWKRAYACQDAFKRVSLVAEKIYTESDKVLQLPTNTRESAQVLGETSKATMELYEQMNGKEYAELTKDEEFFAKKSKSILENTERRLRAEQAERDRIAKKLQDEENARRLREQAEQQKKELINQEIAESSTKFDLIVSQGCFRQLDWDSAFRQLRALSSDFKTEEGRIAIATQIKKVERMKSVQNIFITKFPDYVFRVKVKPPFRGAKVVSVDEKEIVFLKTDNSKMRISWQKFYSNYPGHLNEAIDQFIVNGRTNSGLNLRTWADAMTGAAMTMRIVCSDVKGASDKAAQLAKEVYSKYEDYRKMLIETFPDIDFGDANDEEF